MSRITNRNDKMMELAAQNYANNPGMSAKESMIKAGYSPSTARVSTKITKTTKWQRLMDRYMPDKELAEGVKQLIHAPKITRKYVQGNMVEETETLDAYAINAGLTHAFKLKNKYPSEKVQVEHSFPTPLLDVTSHQVSQDKEILSLPETKD